MKRLKYQPIGDWETIIDPFVPQEPLPLYGSIKQPGLPRLQLDYIIGQIDKSHIDTKTIPEVELSTAFSPANHSLVLQKIISADIFDTDHEIDHWLPLLLSTTYCADITQVKNSIENSPTASIKMVTPKTNSPSMPAIEDEDPKEITDRLLTMLSRSRVDNDHFWLDVGRAIFNVYDGSDEGLQTWIRFTDRSDQHVEEDCRTTYPSFRENNYLTLKTLAWYARIDSPDAYANWHKQWCLPYMDNALTCLHADVAKALYRVCWLEFVCCSLDQNQWYYYYSHRWTRLDHGITLRQFISDGFIRKFREWRQELGNMALESGDQSTKNNADIQIKKIDTLISHLKKVHFKTNIMREAMEHFYHPKFAVIKDMNPLLLGMSNCVLEVVFDFVKARDGKPEDFITMCTGIPYNGNYRWDNPTVKLVMKWMKQIFPDHALMEYFLKMSSSALKGKNDDKIFPIWTGEGDNSKSMLVKLFEACFGPYCIKFPTSLLTGKRAQSSAPMPELARANGTHLAFLQEPDDDECIRGGILKELTGGDSFFARTLNDKGGEVQAMFKLILMCNKVPAIPTGGKAVKNRTRICPYLSTWVSNPPATEAEQFEKRQFKKDPFFELQIPKMASAFMWILVEYYPRYRKEGIEEPPIVKEATSQYWNENDIYRQFVTECIVPAKNDKGEINEEVSLNHGEVYREFKAWYKTCFPGNKVPDSPTVRQELCANGRLGRQGKKQRWYGVALNAQNAGEALAL